MPTTKVQSLRNSEHSYSNFETYLKQVQAALGVSPTNFVKVQYTNMPITYVRLQDFGNSYL